MASTIFKVENAHQNGIWAMDSKLDSEEDKIYVATGGNDNNLKIWEWKDSDLLPLFTINNHSLAIISIDFSANKPLLISSSMDGNVFIVNYKTGKVVNTYCCPQDSWVAKFSPCSEYIVSANQSGKLNFLSIEDGSISKTLDSRGKYILSLSFSVDGKLLACGSIDGFVVVFDYVNSHVLYTLEAHAMPVRCLCFSPDSKILFTGSNDGQIKIYDTVKASLYGCLTGHSSWVLSIEALFTKNKKLILISGSSDSYIKIWDVTAKKTIETINNQHSDQVWCVKSVKNQFLLTASDDCSICGNNLTV